MYVLKDALNHFLVDSSAKSSLRSAKNVVFFLFSILVYRPMGGYNLPPPPAYATESYSDSYCDIPDFQYYT